MKLSSDPHLPQLATLLDPVTMAARLAAHWQVGDCTVGHVRYKPGKKCLVRYDAADARDTGGANRMWYGLAYPPGTSESRWQKASAAPVVPVTAGPGVAHLEDAGMVVWAFPNDRKLPDLDMMLDRRRLAQEVFSAQATAQASDVIRYIPEHGCTARLTCGDAVYFAKRRTVSATETAAHARALGREAWCTTSGIGVERGQPGVPADETTDLAACARALAKLHLEPLPGLRESKEEEWNDRLVHAANLLRHYPSAERISNQVRLRAIGSKRRATLHGDPHVKNFLVEGDCANLIDLDTLHSGDPLDDVASFAASLCHRALLRGEGCGLADARVEALLSEYQRHVPWTFTESEVATALARALLVERACRSITRCKGDVVAPVLALVRRLLFHNSHRTSAPQSAREWMEHFSFTARSEPGQVLDVHYKTYRKPSSWKRSHVMVTRRSGECIWTFEAGAANSRWLFPHDPAAPWMTIAMDPEAVRQHLPVQKTEHVSIEVLNYRPLNRITARYTLKGPAGRKVIYGKTYADERGASLCDRLRQLEAGGFGEAKCLGYSPDIRTVWQEAFEGRPLDDRLEGADNADLVALSAARLHGLHVSGIHCPPGLTAKQQFAGLTEKLSKLSTVLAAPQIDRLDRLMEVLEAVLPAIEPTTPRVLHGDFHLRQLMVNGGSVALFDMDECSLADPMEDLGSLLADLHNYGWARAKVESVGAAFLKGYEDCCGAPVPARRLAWHTAVQMLTRAYRALIQLRPDFDERVDKYMTLAEAAL